MQILQFQHPGPPDEVLQLTDVPLPQPGPGQVLVRVQAAPLNPSDLMFVQDRYGIRPQVPSGAGFEGMGTIDAVGEGVPLSPGRRVSFSGVGSWAQYAVCDARAVIPVPDALPDEAAACRSGTGRTGRRIAAGPRAGA